MKKISSILAAIFLCLLVFVGCKTSAPLSHEYFPVNQAGLSYGAAFDESAVAAFLADHPDYDPEEDYDLMCDACVPELVSVSSEDSADGYVLEEDLREEPATPADAMELTKRNSEGYYVNVYDADTMEIIGVYKIGGTGDN